MEEKNINEAVDSEELEEEAVAADASEENTDETAEAKDEALNEDIEAEAEEALESGEEDKQEADSKKKIFKKKEKKDKKDEQIEALTDQVKRQMAEFDNFRKRTDKEKATMYEMGAKAVIEKILAVVDNFERGLDTVSDGTDEAFAEGMKMIYKQLMTELENLGVKPIEAVGKEFNPDFHNAVMQVESEEYESGIVASELQKGYMYRDSVVRHSMVAVVQ